jgi:exopolysaccharide biosynthesis polyprenyl glycosylphosphotransferase
VGPDTPHASRLAAAVSAPGGDYRVVARQAAMAGGEPMEPAHLVRDVQESVAAHNAEAIVVCDTLNERQLDALIDVALESGCQLLYPAGAVRVGDTRPRLVWHHDQPFFELGAPVLKASAVAAKRVTDVLLAGTLLLVATPMMLLIAVGVRLDSSGPVLFRQKRAGLGGKPFRMLKFRTMHDGADDQKHDLAHLNHTGDVRLFKIHGDPRVTRFGAFLRRWSLDELPQLWNVVRGDMSLVGPRPFFESDFAAYQDHHFRRLDTKPGLTGLWQVSGRSDVVDFEDVVFLDRQYIEQWSFWLDISILSRTIPAVIRRTGAY